MLTINMFTNRLVAFLIIGNFHYSVHACNNLVAVPFLLQVKIWFQNKRSKFKKIIKQGRGTLDSTTQTGEQGLSATTHPTTSVWNSYLTSYTDSTEPAMVPYVSEYNSWYQTVHQEDTQHTQLIWTLSEVTAHLLEQSEILGLELSRKEVDCDMGGLKLSCSPAALCSHVRTNYSLGHHSVKLLFLFLYQIHYLQGNVLLGGREI